jgi:LysM repeat protein
MKRASAGGVVLVLLLVATLAIAGCTKEKPIGRQPDAPALAGTTSATLELTVPAEPVGDGLLPTLTPTPAPTLRATTIAVPPTATPPDAASSDSGFEELIAQPTPTPLPATVEAPGVTVPGEPAPATQVPILTPYPEPGATQPAPVGPVPIGTPTPIAPPPNAELAVPQGTIYLVRWGDTLSSIAAQFGCTVEAIRSANGIAGDNIVVGQQLIIPTTTAPAPGTPGTPGTTVVHIVQPGENLFRIALLYNTTVEAISQANGISNPWFIYVGQQLNIPVAPGGSVPPAPGRTYVVQPGDTLYVIAVRFNTTVEALMVANNLYNGNMLYVGQVLVLP